MSGPAPGPVDGEEAQARDRQAVEMAVGVGHQLVGLLGRRVEAERMVDIVVDRERHLGVGAVDRAGRGIDQVPAPLVPAALQHVEEADEVGVDIGVRVLERVAHAGLGREMHHDRRAGSRRTGQGWPSRSARSSRSKVKPGRPSSRSRRARFRRGS